MLCRGYKLKSSTFINKIVRLRPVSIDIVAIDNFCTLHNTQYITIITFYYLHCISSIASNTLQTLLGIRGIG